MVRRRGVQPGNLKLKISESTMEKYSHIFRKKTTAEFLRLSAGVMGIEIAYSIETAFVSPILLELGIEHDKMTLVWALSPLLGLLLAPFLGSLSDRSKSKYGRRRPLILFLCLGIFLGLTLVPFGKDLGLLLGDQPRSGAIETLRLFSVNLTDISNSKHSNVTSLNSKVELGVNDTVIDNDKGVDFLDQLMNLNAETDVVTELTSEFYSESDGDIVDTSVLKKVPIIAVILTILGTVLMDFDADVCQSPVRAYLLEVCIPEDHAKGLSIFTVMTGVGGFLGYVVGGIDWNAFYIGTILGGNIKTVFILIMIIFSSCILITLTSFGEIPLSDIREDGQDEETKQIAVPEIIVKANGEIADNKGESIRVARDDTDDVKDDTMLSFSQYFRSITTMPSSLRILFLTNLLTWMSHLSYSLYFTDFVGECVFEGDPAALPGSPELKLYNDGVRFGCWGLALYCFTCAAYSTVIDWLLKTYRAKAVFIGGLLCFSLGMTALVLVQTKMAVLVLSTTAGVAYSTLSTIPYLILAQYHTKGKFDDDEDSSSNKSRGLGMDMAIIGSTIFLAQLSLSLGIGWLIQMAGGASVVIWTAAILAFFSALAATQVTYLDL